MNSNDINPKFLYQSQQDRVKGFIQRRQDREETSSVWSGSSSVLGSQSKIADVITKPWKKPKPAIKIISDSVEISGSS